MSSRLALGAVQTPIQRSPWARSPGGQNSWGVKLVTHLYLVPRSKMVELCLHSPVCFRDLVLNLLNTGTTALRSYTPLTRSPFWLLKLLNLCIHVRDLDCYEAGVCCYLMIHIGNLYTNITSVLLPFVTYLLTLSNWRCCRAKQPVKKKRRTDVLKSWVAAPLLWENLIVNQGFRSSLCCCSFVPLNKRLL
jgi:hypothetical protein